MSTDHNQELQAGQKPRRGFLNRWSERKRDAADQDGNAPVALDEAPPIDTEHGVDTKHSEVAEEKTADNLTGEASVAEQHEEVPVLTDADMPDIETLNADSDYSPFFSEGVSKELRNLALKKLFFSGKFSARDGLDDYDDDFTKFEPLGDTVTSDMKFHQRRKEKARLAELELEREKAELEAAEKERADNIAESEAHEPDASESEATTEPAIDALEVAESGEADTLDDQYSESSESVKPLYDDTSPRNGSDKSA